MKRKSAFSRALQEAQNSTTVEQKNGETVKPLRRDKVEQSSGEAVQQQNSTTVKPLNTVKNGLTKTSFYIRRDQVEKLDDLAHEFKKRTGKRIDRQDIVRALIDEINLDNLLNLI
jgi:hypothetical protein